MTGLVAAAAGVALLLQSAGALDSPKGAFKLAGVLTEISGLAVASPTTVFAHNDEFAIIHELDIATGAVLRSFALGKPTVAGDFEGIAVQGGFIYLVTSNGHIYETRPADHGKRADFNVYDTRLGKECEIEGIASGEKTGEFYLLCKTAAIDKKGERLILYKWSFADRLRNLKAVIDSPLHDLAPQAKSFKAADLERDPATGNLLVVDAGGGAVIEITPKGGAVGYWRLAPGRHPQAEGLTLMPNGAIVVGDEGVGGEGLLTVYPPRR